MVFELACSDWTDSLGQGSIDCPIINDDTTIVFASEGTGCQDGFYTGAVFDTPVATFGDNFRITYIAKCAGGCFCASDVGEMCDPEFGFGTTHDAWFAPKAYHWFYTWNDPYTEYGFFWFGGLDYITNDAHWTFGKPSPVHHWGNSTEPFTVEWTYLTDSQTATLRLLQDGEIRWQNTIEDVWTFAGNPYPGDSTPIYPIIRINCGDVMLLRMSVKVW